MSINVGINGFGRIGRLAIRAGKELGGFSFKAINDHKQPKQLAYLFKYDTVFGRYPGEVTYTDDSIIIDGEKIRVFNCGDPSEIPWGNTGAEYIVESTGKFKKLKDASRHLEGGAKKVVVTAPSDEAPTFVMGVNHLGYTKDMTVVSNASCTTNCLAPLAKILQDAYGIRNGVMTTIHAMTTSQNTVDGRPPKDDWRMGRAGSGNLIPTSTGAAKAVGKVLPELKGKLTGVAVRIPTLDVSMVDLVVNLEKPATYEEVCAEIKRASENEMKPYFGYTDDPLVSSDFAGITVGGVFDAKAGLAVDGQFMKLFAWYDNEYGYTCMAMKLIKHMYEVDHK
ncbi:MAG: type I glyceraldehyde-3-phosphate dehydrogenase [Oscillospiraceae bacterium]|nr:type I glyceraldehyde-3-phosphate dehydrogenase [Oscillospiraceae bacterium]